MFKSRRRAAAAAAGSDLPYCPMCQQAIRIDAVTGRCALGHRAQAPAPPAATPESTVFGADVTQPFETSAAPATAYEYDEYAEDPYASIVYGRSEYEYTSPAEPGAWDAPVSAEAEVDESTTWGAPTTGFTYDDHAAGDSAEDPYADTIFRPLDEPGSDEDVDDATHARRRTVGTIGATIAVSGAVFAAVAALPL